MPSITAVITSYGYRDFLAQAIDSVLSQTVIPDDILVVDDGKHDGCAEVARRHKLRYIERENNLGIIKNYNDILYNHVHTENMFILAADDYINPLYVEKMNVEGYDIISCDITLIGEYAFKSTFRKRNSCKDGYYIWNFKPGRSIFHANYIHGSSIYNVEKAKEVGYSGIRGKTEGRRFQEDWMLYRGMIKNGAKHLHISEPLLYYRRHRININGMY